jgi:hypothetical protein
MTFHHIHLLRRTVASSYNILIYRGNVFLHDTVIDKFFFLSILVQLEPLCAYCCFKIFTGLHTDCFVTSVSKIVVAVSVELLTKC